MRTTSPLLKTAQKLWQDQQYGPALGEGLRLLRNYPEQAEMWEFSSYALVAHRRWAEARDLIAHAFSAGIKSPLLHAYNAMALDKLGDLDAALTEAETALTLSPGLPPALLAHIETLSSLGQYDLALAEVKKLPAHEIPDTVAFTCGALTFLTSTHPHEREQGIKSMTSIMRAGWTGRAMPLWDGHPAQDRHVILYSNEGFGDFLQFIRYIEPARNRVARFSLLAPKPLVELLRANLPDITVIADPAETAADVTLRYPLPQLALDAEERFDPRPDSVPYIAASPKQTTIWREKLAHLPRPLIGLAWTSPWQMNNPARAITLDQLRPLLDLGPSHFVSLQLGTEAEQAEKTGLFNAAPFIVSFADSADLMVNLDLVISLDSAPAHLAGAMGRPVWLFLPFNAEWRWLTKREDCIWYPSARLFRQPKPQDWQSVFIRIAKELRQKIETRKSVF